ncbi:T9SS type A sorting domain-containing protein [Rhodocytophaga aerolata]|uniref:T9SS type A sorting domain-containing protein n=1 Tax=Rhodocytophaga aerolata TaxID=455078 RepID=A0ABT8R3T2_9BACT|nr:T9SS type A sorting domain-containing protein [Rhodocytophaga aerolata]MDO1446765.1 T9SS type A sorting domain-containing protein [Rhodocytophaga aerolata]
MILSLQVIKKTRSAFFVLSFSCFYLQSFAATFTSSAGGGNWTSPTSWACTTGPCGAFPVAGDVVTINSGITITTAVSVGSFTINSAGSLTIGTATANSGSLTYSGNSEVNRGRLIVNAGGTLRDTYTGSYPGGTAVLKINGGSAAIPALQITGLTEISNLTIGVTDVGNVDTYSLINSAGNVLVKNAFTMNSDNGRDARLVLEGLLVVKGQFSTSNSGANISTSGLGSFSAQGGIGNGNPANTVVGANTTVGVNYCQASNPCSVSTGDCPNVCTRIINSPLPIVLLSFKAIAETTARQVRLQWITASEENNGYFVVERSKNAQEFEEIDRLNGKGTTALTTTYAIVDEKPLAGISYYRLKQVDIDGKFSYSKSVSVTLETSGIVISPNPVTGKRFTISWASAVPETDIAIFNQLGQQVYAQKISGGDRSEYTIAIDEELTRGVYLLKIRAEGQQLTHKLLIQH